MSEVSEISDTGCPKSQTRVSEILDTVSEISNRRDRNLGPVGHVCPKIRKSRTHASESVRPANCSGLKPTDRLLVSSGAFGPANRSVLRPTERLGPQNAVFGSKLSVWTGKMQCFEANRAFGPPPQPGICSTFRRTYQFPRSLRPYVSSKPLVLQSEKYHKRP